MWDSLVRVKCKPGYRLGWLTAMGWGARESIPYNEGTCLVWADSSQCCPFPTKLIFAFSDLWLVGLCQQTDSATCGEGWVGLLCVIFTASAVQSALYGEGRWCLNTFCWLELDNLSKTAKEVDADLWSVSVNFLCLWEIHKWTCSRGRSWVTAGSLAWHQSWAKE